MGIYSIQRRKSPPKLNSHIFSLPRCRSTKTYKNLARSHLAPESSARSHFGGAWLEKTRLEVNSRSLGFRKLDSKSLRGHWARENLTRSHFAVFWLEKTRLDVTLGSLGLRKLGSKSFRGHLARENATRRHFGGHLA